MNNSSHIQKFKYTFDDDECEVPNEESTNWVTVFSMNTSKLASDKGSVKDHESLMKDLNLVKPSYIKSRTVKDIGELVSKPTSNFQMILDKQPKKRNTAISKIFKNELARLDSPDILKSLMINRPNTEESAVQKRLWKKKIDWNKLYREEIGELSENSDSVSE